MQPILYIGNRNYSSWSLRPWLVLRWGQFAFEARVIPLGEQGYSHRQMASILAVSPSGTVPALHLGSDVISDSLAISEWAAERKPGLWPSDPVARAHARSAACEMHSAFEAVRSSMPCNIRRRTGPRTLNADARREVTRIEALWAQLRARFGGGGPYLFGSTPTITDAFYTPVATRFRTYGVEISSASQAYVDALLGDAAFLEWEAEAKRETWTLPGTDEA